MIAPIEQFVKLGKAEQRARDRCVWRGGSDAIDSRAVGAFSNNMCHKCTSAPSDWLLVSRQATRLRPGLLIAGCDFHIVYALNPIQSKTC